MRDCNTRAKDNEKWTDTSRCVLMLCEIFDEVL